jgi:hypothetical protein
MSTRRWPAVLAAVIAACGSPSDTERDAARTDDAGEDTRNDGGRDRADGGGDRPDTGPRERLDGGPVEPVEVWFRSDFEDLNAGGSNLYGFANRREQSETTWETEHTQDRGWLNSAAPHITIHGCEGDRETCNTSVHQFNAGWTTPSVGGDPEMGDNVFIRFRIRFDEGTNFSPGEEWGAKFILFGETGVTPNSRWIIHLWPPFDNGGCSLGFDYSWMKWEWRPTDEWVEYTDWGFAQDFEQEPIVGFYASFQSHINIGWSCNPGVLVTRSDHALPVPPPGAHSDAPVDGWYHMQFEAVSGPEDEPDFRTWANNNDQSEPTSEHLDMEEGLGVSNWDGPVDIIGYWGTGYIDDIGFVFDDFEVGPEFDPNWAR